jgi:hypothetical protein
MFKISIENVIISISGKCILLIMETGKRSSKNFRKHSLTFIFVTFSVNLNPFSNAKSQLIFIESYFAKLSINGGSIQDGGSKSDFLV